MCLVAMYIRGENIESEGIWWIYGNGAFPWQRIPRDAVLF